MGWATPLCGRPAGYLPPGLWVKWPPATLQWRTSQGRRPENRPGGDDSDPGLASEEESSPTARTTRYLSYQRGLHQHTAKGRDREPRRRGAIADAGRRGNRMYDNVWTVAYDCLFEPVEGTLSSPSTPQILPLCSGLIGREQCEWWYVVGTGRGNATSLEFRCCVPFSESIQVVSLPL